MTQQEGSDMFTSAARALVGVEREQGGTSQVAALHGLSHEGSHPRQVRPSTER
jgi:hypothetical protein